MQPCSNVTKLLSKPPKISVSIKYNAHILDKPLCQWSKNTFYWRGLRLSKQGNHFWFSYHDILIWVSRIKMTFLHITQTEFGSAHVNYYCATVFSSYRYASDIKNEWI